MAYVREGDEVEVCQGLRAAFVVFDEATPASPAERTLDDPAAREKHEAAFGSGSLTTSRAMPWAAAAAAASAQRQLRPPRTRVPIGPRRPAPRSQPDEAGTATRDLTAPLPRRSSRDCRRGALAEGEGFEPSIRFPVYTRSRRAPSTTRPPLLAAAKLSRDRAKRCRAALPGHAEPSTAGSVATLRRGPS